MKRELSDLFSFKTLKCLKYIPVIVWRIKNWVPFLSDYIRFTDRGPHLYLLRNGIQVKTMENIDSSTMAHIFFKKTYGDVEDNSTVIDIGANIGIYSIFAAATSKNTIVYAYEPELNNFNLLLENIKINNLEKNVFPFKLAVSARGGEKELYLNDSPDSHSLYFKYPDRENKSVEIKCVSMKDIFEENNIKQCDILKLDCEGAEFEILYSTPDEYFKKIKIIRLEYHNQNGQNNIQSLIHFLKRKGFKIIKFKKNKKKTPEYNGILWLEKI